MSVTETTAEPRTDEQIIGRTPIKVQLGGREYELHPLSIAKSRIWREQFAAELQKVLGSINLKTEDSNQFAVGLKTAFLDLPQVIADLVFSYAPNLPRKRIEEFATDQELIEAFREVMRLAFPFGDHLTLLTSLGRTTK